MCLLVLGVASITGPAALGQSVADSTSLARSRAAEARALLTRLALTAASTPGYHCVGGCLATVGDTTFTDDHTADGVPLDATFQMFVPPGSVVAVADSVSRQLTRQFGAAVDCPPGQLTGPDMHIRQWRFDGITVLLGVDSYGDEYTVRARFTPFVAIQVIAKEVPCDVWVSVRGTDKVIRR